MKGTPINARVGLAVVAVVVHAVAFTALPLSAQAPDSGLDSAAIASAIARGADGDGGAGLEIGTGGAAAALCRVGPPEGACGYRVYVRGPIGRVEAAARDAAKRYQSLSLDSARILAAGGLVVRVEPVPPRIVAGRETFASAVAHVVLMGRDGVAVQPLSTEPVTLAWSNLLGGERSGQGLAATFAPADVPEGDFEIVVVTEGKEARFGVRAKQHSQLR